MSDKDLAAIADAADMVVQGYAFTRKNGNVSILGLDSGLGLDAGHRAMVLREDGIMLATNMDETEQAVVLKIWESI